MSELRTAPPDGGWGWIVVGASFCLNLILNGIIFSFGILLTPLSEYFQVKRSTVAWAGGAVTGLFLASGPVASRLVQRFGCRPVSMVGSGLAACGMAVAAMSTNIYTFTIAYGIVSGLGFGLVYLPSVVICGLYFEKRRALATAIALCGAGTGGLVLLPLANAILQQFGWYGVIWSFSLMCVSCILISTPMLPLKPTQMITESQDTIQLEFQSSAGMKGGPLSRNAKFLLVCFSNFLAYMAGYVPFVFLPDLMGAHGIPKSSASFVISSIGIAATLSRIASGFLIDQIPQANSIVVSSASAILAGLSTMLFPFCSDLASFTLVSVVHDGAAKSLIQVFRNLVYSNIWRQTERGDTDEVRESNLTNL
eukprot:snap_masked-scaffold487_size158652-processed-gene-0.19 protein:Tk00176 transcript:snap_masked-scaffold487_size158652-processed-gene-0.19-mRNA-1 annotation:"monocarboxylate transporter "